MAIIPRQQTEPSIRHLISSAASDVSTLVSDQIALTKAEIKDSTKEAGNTFGLLIAAGVIGLIGAIFLLVTVAYVLVELGLPTWAGFGIVTLVLLLVAAVLGILGKRHADRVRGPERAKAQLAETKAQLTHRS